MKLRAHNLLCIQGFRGKGYDDAFVENMTRVVEALRKNPEQQVTVIAEPDDLCAACPNLKGDAGCELHGKGTEKGIVSQDEDVARRIGVSIRTAMSWTELEARVRQSIAPDDLDDICGRCPWLPLGYCKEGLAVPRRGKSDTPGEFGRAVD